QGGNNHANLREDRCNGGRYRRNRSWQRGSSRSLVLSSSSSVLPSSLWLLSPPSSLLRLSPVLSSSPLLPSVLLALRFFRTAKKKATNLWWPKVTSRKGEQTPCICPIKVCWSSSLSE